MLAGPHATEPRRPPEHEGMPHAHLRPYRRPATAASPGRRPGHGVGLAIRTARRLNVPIEPGVRDGRDALVRWAVLLESVIA
jgi:hypothetical protein